MKMKTESKKICPISENRADSAKRDKDMNFYNRGIDLVIDVPHYEYDMSELYKDSEYDSGLYDSANLRCVKFLDEFYAVVDIVRRGESWYNPEGYLHKEGGPAYINNHTKEWHKHGLLHRYDAPAVFLSNGIEVWYVNGRQHRLDGPAVTFPKNTKDSQFEWWYKHNRYTFEDWCTLSEKTESEIVYLKLLYGSH